MVAAVAVLGLVPEQQLAAGSVLEPVPYLERYSAGSDAAVASIEYSAAAAEVAAGSPAHSEAEPGLAQALAQAEPGAAQPLAELAQQTDLAVAQHTAEH